MAKGLSVGKSASASNGAKKTTATANRPANQHGVSSGRPKFTRDFIEEYKKEISTTINNLLLNDGYQSTLNISTLREVSFNIKAKLKEQVNYNLRQFSDFYHVDISKIDTKTLDFYISDVEYLLQDKFIRYGKQASDEIKISIINNDIKNFLDFQKRKALNLAKMLIYKSLGYKTILVETHECLNHISTNISSNDLSYARIPPFRYDCKCSVDEESLNEFQG